ncbi:DUF4129 domain-containing protein [Streptomyces sp. NPDC005573]|uniref:DUF4129 domain-containing protein n=1 Tax=Streptomyces sp. NPDC005573 TaxID=3156890 RepID=UPI0033A19525
MSLTGGTLTAVPALSGTAPSAVRLLSHAAVTAWPADTGSGDGPPVTVPREAAREAARRELAKRMYHESDPSLVQRALNAVWHWFGRTLGAASSVTPGGTVGLVAVILVVVAVLAALWWRLGTPHRPAASAPALFDERTRTAADHRAAAEAHAAQEHWSQAVQERMRAIVRSLEERTLLDSWPGRTADEAAAEAGRFLPAHTDRLRSAARQFDDVTYGGRSASEQSYRRIAELDRDLERTRPALADSTADTAHDTAQGAAG